jgi:expansin (peptidoglycan-binding protein)
MTYKLSPKVFFSKSDVKHKQWPTIILHTNSNKIICWFLVRCVDHLTIRIWWRKTWVVMKVREHKFPNETLDLFLSKRLDAKWVLEHQELGHFQTQQLTTHQCSITYTFFLPCCCIVWFPFWKGTASCLDWFLKRHLHRWCHDCSGKCLWLWYTFGWGIGLVVC